MMHDTAGVWAYMKTIGMSVLTRLHIAYEC